MQTRAKSALMLTGAGIIAFAAAQAASANDYVLSEAAASAAADAEIAALVPQELRDDGTLNISVYGNTPYVMTNEDSALFGAVVDLGAAIASRLGLSAVIEDNASVAASRVAIDSGRYHLGMGPFLVSAATEEQFDVISWVRVTPGFVFRAEESYSDVMEFCGKNMATVAGSVPVENNMNALTAACEAAGAPAPVVNAYGDQNASIIAVMSGRDDAAVMGSASALYIASQQSDKLAAFSAESDIFGVGVFSGLGIAKGNDALAQAVLAALRSLAADGTYEAIFASYGLQDLIVDDWRINPVTGQH